jgi:CheY-like chemotaxis protein
LIDQAQQHSGGTGLGLYALSKRMESLGGQCGVEARADGASGSCFWISIPYRPDESEVGAEAVVSHSFINPVYTRLRSCKSINSRDSTDEKEDSSISITPQKLSTLKVLVVDDSALIRKTTSRSLINDGHQVDIAQHGADALKVLEESRVGSQTGDFGFDLVLMDLHMPVMDGLEATRRIRQLEATMVNENPDGGGSRIMIIGLSANTEGEVKADCLESGMDGFLEKPLKMNKFKKYVAKLINDSIQGSV